MRILALMVHISSALSLSMKLSKRLFVCCLLLLGAVGCGSDSQENSSSLSKVSKGVDTSVALKSDEPVTTVNASSLKKVDFNYTASRALSISDGATAVIDLPDKSETIFGNLMLALDVIDLAGISQISLDFSNGATDIPVLQVCGGTSITCNNQIVNTKYRLFITGINPLDYGWQNGLNTIKIWVDNSQGVRSAAASIELNWQAVVITQTQAEFTDIVVNQATGDSTGNLSVSWSPISGYLFYNAFISTEPGINSKNFTSLDEGQARLSLTENSVVFEGVDTSKEYYFTVSGVDDGGESAFSVQNVVFNNSISPLVVNDDIASLDENTSINVSVLDNDSSSNDQLTIVNFTQGENGSVTDNGDGTLTYQHDGLENISDNFTYTVSDGVFTSNPATVSITVNPVNDAPVITSSSVLTLPENTSNSTIVYSASATDDENDELSWSLVDSEGIFSINSTSGEITVNDNSALDFETISPYDLQLTVTDNGSPMESNTISIALTVTDVIENQELVLDPLFGTNGETSFNTYSYSSEETIVNTLRQSDGKLVMVVNTSLAGIENIAAIRLNTNGSVDNSYGNNGRKTFLFTNSQKAQKAIIDSADNLYIVGTETNSNFYPVVLKIDPSGQLDTSFSGDGKFEYTLLPDNTLGADIHIHSNGYVYVALSGYSQTIGHNALKLLRIDTIGNIVDLNDDAGVDEFNLFSTHNFFTIGLNEISTGELVVFGVDVDVELEEGNFAVAVLNATDFSQPAIVSATFDFKQTLDGSGSSDDIMLSYLSLNADSYILAGASNYLQGPNGKEEATMLKVDVSNSAIIIDSDFATSGVFTGDIDGDPTYLSFIETLAVDGANNITFVASSYSNDETIYIVKQIESTGLLKESFNSHTISSQLDSNRENNLISISDLIVDPANNNLYLASVNGLLGNNDIAFQQFLNNGSEILSTYNLVNFTSSNESLIDINVLSVPPNNSALWVSSDKPIDEYSLGHSITRLTSDGQVDHTINKGIAPLQPSYISYGPSIELSDGSIVYTTFDSEINSVTIYKVTDNNFTADINFVPNFGKVQVALSSSSVLSDITYDALNNHIIISGTEISSGNQAFIVKVNATNGNAYTNGNFSNGVAYVDIGANNVSSFEQVIAQSDGTIIGLGNTIQNLFDQGGFEQPFLVKLTSNGELDTSFNASGYKIFDLDMSGQNLKALDLLQLSDTSLIFSVNNTTSSTAHVVKVSAAGVLDSAFSTTGILNVEIDANSTVINDITLDANEDIYAVGYATNNNDDNLVLKIKSVNGSLDPLFNAYTTPGYLMSDEGGLEQLNKVLFDSANNRILLGDTITGPVGDSDIRIRAFYLIQNDNGNFDYPF